MSVGSGTAARWSWAQARARRLERHGLSVPSPDARPADVAAAICGAHAQVLSAAELSIGLRLAGGTRQDVREALWTERSLVKTFGPRGTVHLLPTRDLPVWIGALAAVPPAGSSFPEDVRLTPEQRDEVVEAIAAALADAELTVDELGEAVVAATGPWAGDLVMPAFNGMWPRWRQAVGTAATKGVLCFGPNRGRKVTYTSPRRWLPGFRPAGGRAAVAELLRRYLHAYGPATPRHFAKWFGGPPRWASELFDALAGELEQIELEGTPAWVAAGARQLDGAGVVAAQLLHVHQPVRLAAGQAHRRARRRQQPGHVGRADGHGRRVGGQPPASALCDQPAGDQLAVGRREALQAGDAQEPGGGLVAALEPADRPGGELAHAGQLGLGPRHLDADADDAGDRDPEPPAGQSDADHPAHRVAGHHHPLAGAEEPGDVGGVLPERVGGGVAGTPVAAQVRDHPAAGPALPEQPAHPGPDLPGRAQPVQQQQRRLPRSPFPHPEVPGVHRPPRHPRFTSIAPGAATRDHRRPGRGPRTPAGAGLEVSPGGGHDGAQRPPPGRLGPTRGGRRWRQDPPPSPSPTASSSSARTPTSRACRTRRWRGCGAGRRWRGWRSRRSGRGRAGPGSGRY